MPLSSFDFRQAARQRLDTAQLLYEHRRTLDAMYLAGYAIECSLKALILHHTPAADQSSVASKISRGSKMHRHEVLLELLPRDVLLPMELSKRLRQSTWTTDLRYQSGRIEASDVEEFLITVEALYTWVEGQLP